MTQNSDLEAILLKRPRAMGGLDDEDSALVARARQGEAAAFDQLYRKHRNRMYTLCLNLCGDRDEAADLVQETFMRAWRGLAKFAGRSAFNTWLHRIALHVCRDASRKHHPAADIAPSSVGRAEPETGQARVVLGQLQSTYREVLVLRYAQSLSCQEIADRLNWSLSRVKVTLYRARHAFKDAYLRANEDLP